MNLLWVYDLPEWQFCLLVDSVFIAFAVLGQRLTRRAVRRLVGDPPGCNDVVSYYLGAFGVFYGITLGLLSIAAWQNYSDLDSTVSAEASAMGALYRDVTGYPEPARSVLQGTLRELARDTVEQAWPRQRAGIVPASGVPIVGRLQATLAAFAPETVGQQLLHAETLRAFNEMLVLGRKRLAAVDTGLSPVLWSVVIACAALNLALTWLLVVARPLVHDLLTASLAALIGLLIYITATMDHPLRGTFSIGPDPYAQVLDQVMRPSTQP